ncbi:hypothetical protein ANN_10846 [Periplaneta americana]|uniref:Lipocalin/cytosolic fatty-acid binding domain-containing protein n=1 Tax=Periplaneta americana TaxID=6978 RepID=A0ABQ8T3E5_PERAM|nr:hypothetical protein ANN_10846 [Periplaneta americana]
MKRVFELVFWKTRQYNILQGYISLQLLSVVMATFHVFVLLLALHASMGQNPCLQKSADFANFDIGKFSGTWYTLYHSYNSTDYICYIDTYEALSRSEATLHTSRIDTKTGERDNATGVVQVSDNVLSATISKYRTPSYHVFSTDYVNYAFVGLCRKEYSSGQRLYGVCVHCIYCVIFMSRLLPFYKQIFSISLSSPTLSNPTSFLILPVHFTRSILRHIHISNASIRFSSLRRNVHVPSPYNATLHTKHFTSLFLSSFSRVQSLS